MLDASDDDPRDFVLAVYPEMKKVGSTYYLHLLYFRSD